MIVAALQFRPVFLDVAGNLATLAAWLDAVEADLVVLPELCTTGYFFHDTSQLRTVAEPRDGQTMAFLRGVAADRGMTIVAGFAERDGDALYNAAATVSADGRVDVYRKVHLFAEEKLHFTPGNLGFPLPRRDDHLRLGVMICYDWRFPEAARTLALRGAQVIAHPSNLVAAPRLWQPVMRTRAFENRVFTITANRTGIERRGEEELVFHGCSQIVAPNGRVLAEAGQTDEGWVVSRIDPSRADEKAFSSWNDIITDRRPEAYAL